MQNNLEVNYIIESLNERVNQLTTESIIKDATIKQLVAQIESMSASVQSQEAPTQKKVK